jgi:hypothetical protein
MGRWTLRDDAMNDVSQFATAMVTITFAAVLLVTGQLFTERGLQRDASIPVSAVAVPPR